MAEPVIVDARGLSCPEPAMLALNALLKAASGTLVVLCDNVASRGNVERSGSHLGWKSETVEEAGPVFRITFSK